MKKSFKYLCLVILIILILVLVLFFSRGNEDTWICKNGQWIKHGNPSALMPIDECIKPEEDLSLKTYKNLKAGYEVEYPLNWQLSLKGNSGNVLYDSFEITNNNLSNITIYVNSGLPFNPSKNYSDYATIDDYIKDYKVSGTPQINIQDYLNKISDIKIGGEVLRVQSEKAVDGPNGSVDDSYLFLYNGKYYAISFFSVDRNQYSIDHKVFSNFLSSFVLEKKDISIRKLFTPMSTILPANYIKAQEGWPPVIKNSSSTYSCSVGATNRDIDEQTIQKIINNRTYCIKSSSDGAAGSIYHAYTYTTASTKGKGIETTNFVLRYISCGGYGGPGDMQFDLCKTTQSNYDVDSIVDSLFER